MADKAFFLGGSTTAGRLQLPTGFLRIPDHYTASTYFRQLLRATNTPRYPAYAVDGALLTLLEELSYVQMMKGGSHHIVTQAAEWIRILSQQKITVAQNAARFGYHADYLSVLFQHIYGLSLNLYISEQKELSDDHLLFRRRQS